MTFQHWTWFLCQSWHLTGLWVVWNIREQLFKMVHGTDLGFPAVYCEGSIGNDFLICWPQRGQCKTLVIWARGVTRISIVQVCLALRTFEDICIFPLDRLSKFEICAHYWNRISCQTCDFWIPLRKEYTDLASRALEIAWGFLPICWCILEVDVLFIKTNDILLLKMTSCPYLNWADSLANLLFLSF